MPPLSINSAKKKNVEPLAASKGEDGVEGVIPSPELVGKDGVFQAAVARIMETPSRETPGADGLLRGGLTALFGAITSCGKPGLTVGGR